MKAKMKIYLDIDGVLLTKQLKPAKHFSEFIGYITMNFNCFWLTTHCKGNSGKTVEYLMRYVPKDTLPALQKIQPTNWNTLKTEAIDFKSNFLWMDDYLLDAEKAVLQQNNCLKNHILIDLVKEPEGLKKICGNIKP